MAKLVYLGASGENTRLIDFYSIAGGTFVTSGNTTATWVDSETGGQMTFEGSKLKFEAGVLVSGRVEKILFEDVEGANIAKFTGDFDAKKLGAALEQHDVLALYDRALRGNDVIIGSERDDYILGEKGKDTIRGGDGNDDIRGGLGNDRLFGGHGSDHFLFFTTPSQGQHDGNDTIMDFDANGGGIKQDYIAAEWNDVSRIHRSGDDTIIDFKGGGSIRLIDVDRADIDHHDFITLI